MGGYDEVVGVTPVLEVVEEYAVGDGAIAVREVVDARALGLRMLAALHDGLEGFDLLAGDFADLVQDPSLEDMATQYPSTLDELTKITGVSQGKATRYGKEFVELIAKYVEDNEIEIPNDFVVKNVANKSALKYYLIQNIDRKVPLEDIAKAKDLGLESVYDQIESIVASGTKLNLDYYINDVIEHEHQSIIYDYFKAAQDDSLKHAFEELQSDGITMEELQLVRIKFMSEMAN